MSISKQQPSGAAQKLVNDLNRYQALLTRRTKAETEVDTAARQLAEAQEEAIREFGTGDLEKLRELFTTNEAANEQLVKEFSEKLDALEAALRDVEKALAG